MSWRLLTSHILQGVVIDSIIDALKRLNQEHLNENKSRELFTVIINSKETNGFWSLGIVVNPEYKHLISHIERIGMDIGRIYGEGLGVEKKWNYIFFS